VVDGGALEVGLPINGYIVCIAPGQTCPTATASSVTIRDEPLAPERGLREGCHLSGGKPRTSISAASVSVASRSAASSTHLETWTKESNMCASQRANYTQGLSKGAGLQVQVQFFLGGAAPALCISLDCEGSPQAGGGFGRPVPSSSLLTTDLAEQQEQTRWDPKDGEICLSMFCAKFPEPATFFGNCLFYQSFHNLPRS
jgi:hypothetical protein